ncbi:hypothetical protein CZ794_04800 [Psychrobacter sp. JB385]|nr:hypothetical protein CZ794_04800 [Psychrobacter sp. JB385]
MAVLSINDNNAILLDNNIKLAVPAKIKNRYNMYRFKM